MLKLAKQVISAQMLQLSVLLCSIAIQLAVARYIGPSALGVTAIIIANSALGILLIELNLMSALVRRIASSAGEQRDDFVTKTLTAKLTLSFLLSPLIAVFAAALADHHQGTIFIGVIAAIIAQQLNPGWYLQGVDQTTKSYQLLAIVGVTTFAVGFPIIAWFRIPGSENLLLSLLGVTVYGVYWGSTGYLGKVRSNLWTGISSYLRFAKSHLSFLIGGVAIYLYLYPAQLILAYSRGPDEAGMYRVALMPGVAFYTLTTAAYYAYYPILVRERNAGSDVVYRNTARFLVIFLLAASIAAWGVCMAIRGIWTGTIGSDFESAILLSPGLLLSKAIGGMGFVIRACLLAQHLEKKAFLVYLGIGLLALAANMYIAPIYGMLGVAVVEFVSESLHLMLLLVLLNVSNKYAFSKQLGR